jgi:ribosomal protein S18 acetylase RimI-like enzyme
MNVRRATASDCAFVSRIILEAETSGAEITSYEKMFGKSREELAPVFEKAIADSPGGHALTWRTFFIAEENGQPAAALSAYIEGSNGDSSHLTTAVLMTAFPRAEVSAAFRFLRSHSEVSLSKGLGTLQVDCVATLPEFRGKGALRTLLEAAMEFGKSEGAKEAQIQVWKKNTGAIAAYERLGFRITEEKESSSEPGNGKVIMTKALLQ